MREKMKNLLMRIEDSRTKENITIALVNMHAGARELKLLDWEPYEFIIVVNKKVQ